MRDILPVLSLHPRKSTRDISYRFARSTQDANAGTKDRQEFGKYLLGDSARVPWPGLGFQMLQWRAY